MKYSVIGAVALLAASLHTTPLDAQPVRQRSARPAAAADSAQPRQMRMQRAQRPSHPAAQLLRLREQLALTDAQVQRLESLQKTPLPQVRQSDIMRAQADLLDATRGDGNPEAARAALERMNKLRVDQQVAVIRARKDARDVLTAEQKAQLTQVEQRFVNNRREMVRNRGMRPGAPARARAVRPGRAMQGPRRGGQGMIARPEVGPRRMGPQGPRPVPPAPPARRNDI